MHTAEERAASWRSGRDAAMIPAMHTPPAQGDGEVRHAAAAPARQEPEPPTHAENGSGAAVPAFALADGVLRPVDPRYPDAERVSWWILTGIVSIGSAAGIAIPAIVGAFHLIATVSAAAGWAALTAFLLWMTRRFPALVYAHLRYAVSPLGIEIRKGVVWRRIINVARARVQHTDVVQGPIARRFGIATLVVYTAGTEHSAVTLEGLALETATAVREYLVSGCEEERDAV
jgi:membrane protein YdbS with pleckstrin-like domain